jgi:hypothetical protein
MDDFLMENFTTDLILNHFFFHNILIRSMGQCHQEVNLTFRHNDDAVIKRRPQWEIKILQNLLLRGAMLL